MMKIVYLFQLLVLVCLERFYIACSVLPALAVGLCRLVSRKKPQTKSVFSVWLIVWNKSVQTCLRQVWADKVLELYCPWCMLMISFYCSWQSTWINSVISLSSWMQKEPVWINATQSKAHESQTNIVQIGITQAFGRYLCLPLVCTVEMLLPFCVVTDSLCFQSPKHWKAKFKSTAESMRTGITESLFLLLWARGLTVT